MSEAAQLDALAEALQLVDQVVQLKRRRPLAMASLWHQDKPKTSQRRSFQNLGELVTIICGGNRSGKTAGCAQYAVASALGRDHPDAQEWCKRNGIDTAVLPSKPGNVWAVALDSGDSREYLRPAVSEYLPPDSKWRNQFGYGRAEVRMANGGRIMFPSVDMGRDGFQGAAVDLVWFDEEPADEAVVNEALMRLVDRQGRCIFSMTPLRGMTWLYDRWISNTPDDCRVHWIHGTDNPFLPPNALERLLRQYGPHERAARARGEWTTLEGRVFQDWQRSLHVVDRCDLDDSAGVYMGIDWGTRAPTAVVVGKLDRDDRLWIVDEYYEPQRTVKEHAKAIQALIDKHGEPEWIVCDPEDRGARLALSRDYGIANIAAKKGPNSVRAGINVMAERIAKDARGMPGLFVLSHCTNFIREIESYIWDPKGAGEGRDRPKPNQADHLLDACRYLCMRLGSTQMFVG